MFAVLLTTCGAASYRAAIAADLASFVVCAALLAVLVHPSVVARSEPGKQLGPAAAIRRVVADRTFLLVMAVNASLVLSMDFFLSGVPVYVLDELHGQPWLPGVMLTVSTAVLSVGGTVALRVTRRFSRTAAIRAGALLRFCWCAVSLAAAALPTGSRPVALLAATVVSATASPVAGGRVAAMVVDIAPADCRGQYLALFQYSFALPTFIAPAVTALFAESVWLPWLVVAASATMAAVAPRPLRARLPVRVLHPNLNR